MTYTRKMMNRDTLSELKHCFRLPQEIIKKINVIIADDSIALCDLVGEAETEQEVIDIINNYKRS